MPGTVQKPLKFAPVRNPFYPLTYVFLTFTTLLVLHFSGQFKIRSWIDILVIAIWVLGTIYYSWIWTTGTYYQLREGYLFYRSGFTKGKIPVSSIRKIETNTRGWGNMQAALTFRGLMITYNKWDEVFIAPQAQTEFLAELLKLNPEIEIIEPQAKNMAQ